MRVLLLGAYGFIGSEIARRLIRDGHTVVGLGRDVEYGRRILPDVEWHRCDLDQMTAPADWRAHLENVDWVINASGLLQSGDGGTVSSVQFHAIAALIQASEDRSLDRFVQISAAGASAESATDFMRAKAQADEALKASQLPWVILRPGLVIGRNAFGGTELIRGIAAMPVSVRLPAAGSIQCIAMEDLVDAVMVALTGNASIGKSIDLVDRSPRPLDEIIAEHRAWLGLGKAPLSCPLPRWSLTLASRLADGLGHLGWRPALRSNAVASLIEGVSGDASQTSQSLGREPLSLEQALNRMPAGKQDRLAARLFLTAPLMLAALLLMWFSSGMATLARPSAAEAPLLAQGVGAEAARSIAIVGGMADVLLALGLWSRTTVRPALLAMILITIVYLAGATILIPHLWLDPFAPLAKAIPAMILALIAFWAIERR